MFEWPFCLPQRECRILPDDSKRKHGVFKKCKKVAHGDRRRIQTRPRSDGKNTC